MPDPTPTLPTDDAARGITDAIDGFVAQNVDVDEQPIRQEFPDQAGAIRGGKVYDRKFTFSLNVYTAGAERETKPFGNGDVVQFRSEYWAIDNCRRVDTYNDTVKWTVTGHRHVASSDNGKYPSAPSSSSSSSSSGTGT